MQRIMKKCLVATLIASAVMTGVAARAQSEASQHSSNDLQWASVIVIGASAGAAALLAGPVSLSVDGAKFVAKSVQTGALRTAYVLERVSDGAQVVVEVASRGLGHASVAAGTAVTASAIGAGTILVASGEVIAFIPNALGRELLHNERLTW